MNIKKITLLPLLMGLALSGNSTAGEDHTEKGLLLEISYLAKKLLDMSGEDSYTAVQPAYTKAFIGICSSVEKTGVLLTCVTPGTEAEKAGLLTGDIITSMNGTTVPGGESKEDKKANSAYWNIFKNMKVGDVIKVTLIRDGKTLNLDVGVGELIHPKVTLKVEKSVKADK